MLSWFQLLLTRMVVSCSLPANRYAALVLGASVHVYRSSLSSARQFWNMPCRLVQPCTFR